jgi:hypothetical protein
MQEIVSVLQARGLRCTHFDALRFFAPDAKGLNLYGDAGADGDLVREVAQPRLEQAACVHASMDLLKHAIILARYPCGQTGNDVKIQCLDLALAARKVDMCASPYDVTPFGFTPIKVEGEEGRRLYKKAQMELMGRASPIRSALIHCYSKVIAMCNRNARYQDGSKP